MKSAARFAGVVLSLVLAATAWAQQPQPLPAGERAERGKGGAQRGWMVPGIPFLNFKVGAVKPHAGDAPGFSWDVNPTPARLLPAPEPGFGLAVSGPKATDENLKEWARFDSLQVLSLIGCPATGTGLKDLAGLKQLQTLALTDSKLTDAGLKEVARLGPLQML